MYEKENYKIFLGEFKNIENKHYMKNDLEYFADEMAYNDLITRSNEPCRMTSHGIDVCKMGGWLKYLEIQTENSQTENENVERKSQLEIKNLALQNENFEYQKSLREKDGVIRDLTEKNLKLQNKSLKRTLLFIFLGALLGFIGSNFKITLEFLGIIENLSKVTP